LKINEPFGQVQQIGAPNSVFFNHNRENGLKKECSVDRNLKPNNTLFQEDGSPPENNLSTLDAFKDIFYTNAWRVDLLDISRFHLQVPLLLGPQKVPF